MIAFLIGICYVVGFLVIFGLISLLCFWLRYCIAIMYALLPILGAFWAAWALLIAIPLGLIADGSWLEKKVVIISHWLNDATWELLKFCFLFPFKLFIWSADIITWIMKFLGA